MMHAKHNEERRSKAANILSAHGYGKMKHLATEAVHDHEKNMHKGKKETKLHLATGGCATGGAPHMRMDRKARAAGGRNKHKEPHVAVNVINAGGKQPAPMPMPAGSMAMHPPMMPPPQAAPPMAPQHPPMPPPQGAVPPPGGMPQRPPMMNAGGRLRRAGGGPVKNKTIEIPHLEGGSGGGLGRLEKAEAQSKRKSA